MPSRGGQFCPPAFLRNRSFLSPQRKKRMVSGFQEKKEGEVPTIALNLTLKIPAFSCPLPRSLPSERALRSARAFRREGSGKICGTGRCGHRPLQGAAEVGGGRADRVVRPYRRDRECAKNRKATKRRGRLAERKKETTNMELSPPRRKRNAVGFF